MSQVVILDSETLSVVDWYPIDSPVIPVTPGVTLTVPEGMTWDTVRGVEDPSSPGTYTLEADPTKLTAKLDEAWASLRTERNRRLAATDWTQLQDSHLSAEKKAAWADYRQELRDLPDELADPTQVEWPLDPTVIPPTPVTGSRLSSLLDHAGESVPVPEAEPVPEAVA